MLRKDFGNSLFFNLVTVLSNHRSRLWGTWCYRLDNTDCLFGSHYRHTSLFVERRIFLGPKNNSTVRCSTRLGKIQDIDLKVNTKFKAKI